MFLITYVFVLLLKPSQQQICNATIDRITGVEWPSTSNFTHSKPLCLNRKKEIEYRRCSNGQWMSQPACFSLQAETLPQCPDKFTDSGTLCYWITPKTTFPPECPFENVVPFVRYKDVTSREIWVPAKRQGLGFMKWIESSWFYKREIDNYNFSKPVKDKNCLVYYRQRYTLVSCNAKYRGVCAYEKLGTSRSNLCGSEYQCLQSDFSSKSNCFCLETTTNYPLAGFLNSYQYNLYKKLTNENCSIGFAKNWKGRYFWTYNKTEISYTYWSSETTFGNGLDFGAATPKGWILTQQILPCLIFEKKIENLEPSLHLEFNETDRRFLLTVENPQGIKILNLGILVFCFTNAGGLKSPYLSITVVQNNSDSILYSFEPLKNSSGDYWCEAFKQIDSTIIKTEKYFFKDGDLLEFVAFFKVEYNTNFNPLSKNIFSLLESDLLDKMNGSYIQNLKLMGITELDEDNQEVVVNVHIILTAPSSGADVDYYHRLLKFTIVRLIHRKPIELVNLLNTEFCPAENGYLSWPKTPIGEFANPEQFCFQPNGSPISRVCDGDFINGAQWSEYDRCEVFRESSVTGKLVQVNKNSSLETMQEMYEISENYRQFTSLDIYLVAEIYSGYLRIPSIDVFAQTIDNLLNIRRSILSEAQLKLRATDKILSCIDNITVRYGKFFEYRSKNFILISSASRDLSGLVVTKEKSKVLVTPLTGDQNLEDIIKIKNLESAIWLSPDFRNQLKSWEAVTFSIYFNDAFFPKNSSLSIETVFGMIASPFGRYFQGPVKILQRIYRHHHVKSSCAFWAYNDVFQGSWRNIRRAAFNSPFLTCDFWQYANFAIVTPVDGVTDDLKNLLESNNSVPETMEKLSQISEQYEKFAPVDLGFVGQILERVSDNEEVDFSDLAKTISNIQQVERDVLTQSQLEEEATDSILTHLDSIIMNHHVENTVEVTKDNFMILVVDLKENFSGVALLRREETLEPVFLNSNTSFEEILQEDDFDSAVVLSPELQQQFDGNLIVTVFSNDALFNQKIRNYKFVSKIFGVILPKSENFSGPVSIIYKSEEFPQNQTCAFWYYDHQHNISGYWKEDGDSENFSSIVQCDFWHTTHFAYLILDDYKFDNDFDNIFGAVGLLTSINCVLSLISLTLVVLTAILFRQWRENTGNKILLNFSLINIIQIIIFYVSSTINQLYKNYILCTIIGILLHYSIVSQFCWMFVIAILQFRRFVIVLDGPPNFVLLKACVCGWLLPLLPVFFVFGLDRENYVKSNVGLCYPSGLGLYLGIWLPISIIILINFILFSITLYNVIYTKAERVIGSSDAMYQWRLAVFLFFMLGFTWSFGFLAELDFGVIFEYLFCMTATLQGFTLFIFFIVFNRNTRYLYVSSVGRYCKRKFK